MVEELKAKIKKIVEKGVVYDTENHISFSQFSKYFQCPKSWELAYARNLRKHQSSIYLIYGTSLHETLQHYIDTCFTHSAKAADEIHLGSYLKERMAVNYLKEKEKTGGAHFSTQAEMTEFWTDGFLSLDWIRKRRSAYFNSRRYILLAIELPLYLVASEDQQEVKFVAYLDLVFWDKTFSRVKIIDIKTSSRGWFKKDKEDEAKKAQVILYKKYFNKHFGVPMEDIEVEFFIVKRKLWEESDYAQKRVQEFSPAQGRTTINKFSKIVDEFVGGCFNTDGTYNLEKEYPAYTRGCKYCEFKDREDLCPSQKRLNDPQTV